MKVLITGGAGFLGFHLAKYFSGKKYQVYLVDIQSPDKKEYPKSSVFYKADIRDKKSILKIFKSVKPDYIVHAAAALPLADPDTIFSVNIRGTGNVLYSAKITGAKRFIYISSTAVYGVPAKHPIVESDERVGVGPYGQSKIDAENLCFDYLERGLDVTIIRPKTFLGTHRLGVFEILFDWIHDGKKIPVIGDGNNRYQLLEVTDLAEAIYLFLKRSLLPEKKRSNLNGAFNIGAEKFTTVKGDFQIFFKKVKSKSRILTTPSAVVKKALWIFEKLHLSPLYQWVYDTADKDSFVSIDKLMSTLNWRPKYSNADSLTKAYLWYLKNYREIKSRGTGITHTVGWRQGILSIIKKFM